MGDKSKIEWTDASWNPVTGCSKVSQGCKHCYAEGAANRFWLTQYPQVPTGRRDAVTDAPEMRPRTFTDVQCHDDRLVYPLKWKRPRMIFVNSMSDLFHEAIPFDFVDRVFAVMALSREHTFQVLTKRHRRMREYFGDTVGRDGTLQRSVRENGMNVEREMRIRAATSEFMSFAGDSIAPIEFPLPNVWLCVSAEDQVNANARIPDLLMTPAAVRGVSLEPLIGPIDLTNIEYREDEDADHVDCVWNAVTGQHEVLNSSSMDAVTTVDDGNARLDWVIVGGESGTHHRPISKDWVRSLRDQCVNADVAFFFKQWGGLTPKSGGRYLDGRIYSQYPRRVTVDA